MKLTGTNCFPAMRFGFGGHLEKRRLYIRATEVPHNPDGIASRGLPPAGDATSGTTLSNHGFFRNHRRFLGLGCGNGMNSGRTGFLTQPWTPASPPTPSRDRTPRIGAHQERQLDLR